MTPPTRPTIVSAVLPRLMLFNVPLVIHPPTAPAIAPITRTNEVVHGGSSLRPNSKGCGTTVAAHSQTGGSGADSKRSLLLIVVLRRSPATMYHVFHVRSVGFSG